MYKNDNNVPNKSDAIITKVIFSFGFRQLKPEFRQTVYQNA